MKKIFKFFTAFSLLACLASCGVNGTCNESGACGGGDLDLDYVNEYFENDPQWKFLNLKGNKVTLIPFTHINGPKDEWAFFGIVNYEYDAIDYFKYQVTYLSCTCRAPEVNYWQTAYVELSVPQSGNADDIELQMLSFEKDGTGHYNAGFWGDSGTNGYFIDGSKGVTYEAIKVGFIPYLVGKTKAELSLLNQYDDINKDDFNTWAIENELKVTLKEYTKDKIDENGKPLDQQEPTQIQYDTFLGASVSTNNIIRIVNALIEYHAANNI